MYQYAIREVAFRPEDDERKPHKTEPDQSRLIEGFESPYGMELLASVHWVATHSEERATDPESTIEAIHRWTERKQRAMKPEHIRIAWQRLYEGGWGL